ncbi:MarR family transcriptional regulator [Streptomyces sp. NPDC002033]|uniref:MarR family transcriptional regulator n=1 Tax=unclassified Streptomyces TaxID=2593676 RepID=UPI00331E7360
MTTVTTVTTTAALPDAPLPDAPLADARMLGLAHYAARGVLERVLARHGLTFQEQVALRAAVAGAPQPGDALAARVQDSLKAGPAEAAVVVDALLAKRLLSRTDGALLSATDAGRELLTAVAAETAPVTARVWAGIPAEDLAAAARVLTLVTARAEAELAAEAGGAA